MPDDSPDSAADNANRALFQYSYSKDKTAVRPFYRYGVDSCND